MTEYPPAFDRASELALDRYWVDVKKWLSPDKCFFYAESEVDVGSHVDVRLITEWISRPHPGPLIELLPEVHPLISPAELVHKDFPTLRPMLTYHHKNSTIAFLDALYRAVGDQSAWRPNKVGGASLHLAYRPVVERAVISPDGDGEVVTRNGLGVVKYAELKLRDYPPWLESRLSLGQSTAS